MSATFTFYHPNIVAPGFVLKPDFYDEKYMILRPDDFEPYMATIEYQVVVVDEDGYDSGCSYCYNEDDYPNCKLGEVFFNKHDERLKIIAIDNISSYEIEDDWLLCSMTVWNKSLPKSHQEVSNEEIFAAWDAAA